MMNPLSKPTEARFYISKLTWGRIAIGFAISLFGALSFGACTYSGAPKVVRLEYEHKIAFAGLSFMCVSTELLLGPLASVDCVPTDASGPIMSFGLDTETLLADPYRIEVVTIVPPQRRTEIVNGTEHFVYSFHFVAFGRHPLPESIQFDHSIPAHPDVRAGQTAQLLGTGWQCTSTLLPRSLTCRNVTANAASPWMTVVAGNRTITIYSNHLAKVKAFTRTARRYTF